jgi:hypothetical protein
VSGEPLDRLQGEIFSDRPMVADHVASKPICPMGATANRRQASGYLKRSALPAKDDSSLTNSVP